MTEVEQLMLNGQKLMDDRNYVQAKIVFEKVLEKESHNYMALIFLGKILGKSAEALTFLRTAAAVHPHTPLAWNCLAEFFEQGGYGTSAFVRLKIYEELLSLNTDKDNCRDVVLKVVEIGYNLKDYTSIRILIHYLAYRKPCRFLFNFTELQLLELLKKAYSTEQLAFIVDMTLQIVVKDPPMDLICILLGKIILLSPNFVQAFEQLTKFYFFPYNVTFREWLCKYLCSIFAKEETFLGLDIDKFKNDMIRGIVDSKYPRLLNSMIFYHKKKYVEAYSTLNNFIEYESAEIDESIFFIKCTFKNRYWTISEMVATKFLVYSTGIHYTHQLTKYLFLALAHQKKWPQAVNVARNVLHVSLAVEEQVLLATCYIESKQNPERILNILQPTVYYKQLKALILLVKGQYHESINMLQRDIESSVNLFYIGKSYWLLKQFEIAYIHFTKAFELDPWYAESVYYIGLYYENHKMNLETAKSYYEKAHKLDCTNSIYLKSLSDLYLNVNLKLDNYNLLLRVNNLALTLPWLHFRMGVYLKENCFWKSAIEQFKYVVKYDTCDVQAVEYLAEAYLMDGCAEMAIKTFVTVIALSRTREAHCRTRIANIQLVTKQYSQALYQLKKVKQMYPSYSLALKGLAECYIKFAKLSAHRYQYGNARREGQMAIISILGAIKISKMCLNYWNTLARIILFIATLPHKHCYLDVNFGIYQELGNLGQIRLKINLYKLGFYCFWRGQCVQATVLDPCIHREIAYQIFNDKVITEFFKYSGSDFSLHY